jgi:hypothetical protein
MTRARDLANGESRFVNTAGDTMSGNLYAPYLESTGPVRGTTQAAAGRGVLITQPSGNGSAAILQFTNYEVNSQLASITVDGGGTVGINPIGAAYTVDINGSPRMLDVYNKTTTAGANVLIATVPLGYLYRSTASSIRWKRNVKDLTGDLDASKLLDLPVHQFKFKNDYLDENDQRYDTFVPGFIAEEVAEIYPIAAERDEDGTPSDWNSRLLLPPMLKLIQDQAQKIEELEARISALEGN